VSPDFEKMTDAELDFVEQMINHPANFHYILGTSVFQQVEDAKKIKEIRERRKKESTKQRSC